MPRLARRLLFVVRVHVMMDVPRVSMGMPDSGVANVDGVQPGQEQIRENPQYARDHRRSRSVATADGLGAPAVHREELQQSCINSMDAPRGNVKRF
jgi:hypothetical protein